jgi:hypothetical protein
MESGNELYELFSEPDIVKTIKTGRLRLAGHVIQAFNDNPVKTMTLLKPDGDVEELEDQN